MHNFFVASDILAHDSVVLTGPIAHQLSRVLRLTPGEHIVLLDDSGWACEAQLEQVGPDRALARILSRSQPQTEPRVHLTLCQALVTENKMDWILQKGVELGVSAFVPLTTQRSLPARAGNKLARWQRIVTEAAEQAGRARLPTIAAPRPLAACLPPERRSPDRPPPDDALALIGWVSAEAEPLAQVLRALPAPPARVALFIGPEGGFTTEEAAQARAAGVRPVAFGPRTLRTETAGLAATAALLYALGEWG
jgi:16S rRNA (uracil1498-N3)-methyltransferase